ncbi:RNA polymerase sigma factor [Knoellia sp. CPCC 206435]|uniref:RNA polymerase sigma factor n=1 Tax=Knoellia terrae TaxID=3404797 RepID=UPI003B43076C
MWHADEPADAELVRALHRGDVDALRMLYDRHAPWLAARLRRRCSDQDAVADALQDCFTSVWRTSGSWRGDGEVAAWLWGIAIRRLVSRLRSSSAGAGRELPEVASSAMADRSSESAEERVLLGIEYGDLGGALERLSPQMRAVVEATVLDGLTSREAATLLGIPQNTVKTRLHRAKAQLRADLAGGAS